MHLCVFFTSSAFSPSQKVSVFSGSIAMRTEREKLDRMIQTWDVIHRCPTPQTQPPHPPFPSARIAASRLPPTPYTHTPTHPTPRCAPGTCRAESVTTGPPSSTRKDKTKQNPGSSLAGWRAVVKKRMCPRSLFVLLDGVGAVRCA